MCDGSGVELGSCCVYELRSILNSPLFDFGPQRWSVFKEHDLNCAGVFVALASSGVFGLFDGVLSTRTETGKKSKLCSKLNRV